MRGARVPVGPVGRSLRTLRRIGRMRLGVTVIVLAVALVIAGAGRHIPLLRDGEMALYDLRIAATAPAAAPFAGLPPLSLSALALLVVALGVYSGAADVRRRRVAIGGLVQLAAIGSLPFLLQAAGVDTRAVPAAGWLLGWMIACGAGEWAVRGLDSDQRAYARSALGRTLPRAVALDILRDPERLRLDGETREIVALVSDLEGVAKLSHALAPEAVATLLNRYLDRMGEIVLAHGGTIDTLAADAIVAFWGAPLSRPDDAARAVRAALALHAAGERFRVEMLPGGPPIGHTRIGLDRGIAVVGNLGGRGRLHYTAIGEVMTTAALLGRANSDLETAVLASRGIAAAMSPDAMRPLGRVCVGGRSTAIEIFEPLPLESARDWRPLADLLRRFDDGESAALGDLATLAAARPGDAALAKMFRRLEEVGPGGSYSLGA